MRRRRCSVFLTAASCMVTDVRGCQTYSDRDYSQGRKKIIIRSVLQKLERLFFSFLFCNCSFYPHIVLLLTLLLEIRVYIFYTHNPKYLCHSCFVLVKLIRLLVFQQSGLYSSPYMSRSVLRHSMATVAAV